MKNQFHSNEILISCFISCIEQVKPKNFLQARVRIEKQTISFLNQNDEIVFTKHCEGLKRIFLVGGGKVLLKFNLIFTLTKFLGFRRNGALPCRYT